MGYYETEIDGYYQKVLDIDFVIEDGFVLERHDIIIADGVELKIEEGGELLLS